MLCRTIGFSALKLIPTQSISLCDLIDKKMFFLPDSKLLAKFTCAVKIHMRFPRIILPCFMCIILATHRRDGGEVREGGGGGQLTP